MSEGTQRRLTTIVAADIAGFSRLVGIDEEATLLAQRGHRAELIEPLLAEHHGRIANTAGDSFLFEFPSAVEAVRCSVAVQDGMAERNRDIVGDRRIEYRIGINVGDVVADGDDLLGDGVNIAARLENLCTPGGIILSDDAYRQIRDRLDLAWDNGGEHEIKNIARPVQIWRWGKAAEATVTPMMEAPLPLPDKPSIAVLPFDNMSGDPEQEYFSDGITEDIITALSKFRTLFVTARNSCFSYKGTAPNITEVGQTLGVRYVLEGSVRKAGDRVRITSQLIDAQSGNHVWAEQYDRNLIDVFDVQDEITGKIVAAIDIEIRAAEVERSTRKSTSNLDAWEHYHRGMIGFYRFTQQGNLNARREFERAIEIDTAFALAHAGLALTHSSDVTLGLTNDPEATLNSGREAGQRAVDLDEKESNAHLALSRVAFLMGKYDVAFGAAERAIAINPNSSLAHYACGHLNSWTGNFQDAVDAYAMAIRLSPRDPLARTFFLSKALALRFLDKAEEAVAAAKEGVRLGADRFWTHLALACASSFAGDINGGRQAIEEVIRLKPDFSIMVFRELLHNYDEDNFALLAADLHRLENVP